MEENWCEIDEKEKNIEKVEKDLKNRERRQKALGCSEGENEGKRRKGKRG